jgi:ABC-type phosphate/phosphonate transport system substrate-binding protein
MHRRRFMGISLGSLLTAGFAFDDKRQEVRIGLLETMFPDIPEKSVKASIDQFREIMERETRHTGESVTLKTYSEVAEQLEKDKIQLGALHGFEYAWIRPKHGDLRPLVVAVNQQTYIQAIVVVQANGPARDFPDLKGQTIAIPEHTKEDNRLFLEHLCKQAGEPPDRYFSKTTKPASVEDALDDLVDGVVAAALVDSVSLDRYRSRKPTRFARLRDLKKSPQFPPTAVLYKAGALEQVTLARFRKALVELNRKPEGKEVLTTWKLTGFEPVRKDYDQHLEEIAAAYPPPQGM